MHASILRDRVLALDDGAGATYPIGMGLVSNLRNNASFYVVMLAIAVTTLAMIVALFALFTAR